MTQTRWMKCKGSGNDQVIDWDPTDDYPGASVCTGCSFGVLLLKGKYFKSFTGSGHEARFGTLRTHYVRQSFFRYQWEYDRMTYHKPKRLRDSV